MYTQTFMNASLPSSRATVSENENQENKVRTEQDISPTQAHDQEANSTNLRLMIKTHCWLNTSGTSQAKSETGCYKGRARRDPGRARQTTLDR